MRYSVGKVLMHYYANGKAWLIETDHCGAQGTCRSCTCRSCFWTSTIRHDSFYVLICLSLSCSLFFAGYLRLAPTLHPHDFYKALNSTNFNSYTIIDQFYRPNEQYTMQQLIWWILAARWSFSRSLIWNACKWFLLINKIAISQECNVWFQNILHQNWDERTAI